MIAAALYKKSKFIIHFELADLTKNHQYKIRL